MGREPARADGFSFSGQVVQDILRCSGFPEELACDPGDARCLLGRFHDDGVAGDQRSDGHAHADRQGKVPRTDDDGDAPTLVVREIQFADELAQTLRSFKGEGLPRVVLAEINGFADVGVRFPPCLAGFRISTPESSSRRVRMAAAALRSTSERSCCGRSRQAGNAFNAVVGHPVDVLDRAVVGDRGNRRVCNGRGERVTLTALGEVVQ